MDTPSNTRRDVVSICARLCGFEVSSAKGSVLYHVPRTRALRSRPLSPLVVQHPEPTSHPPQAPQVIQHQQNNDNQEQRRQSGNYVAGWSDSHEQ